MKKIKSNFAVLLFALFSVSLQVACSSNVKSWEKGILAEDRMQLGGGNAPLLKVNEHTFTSKEATFGGMGIGGGGCGCN